MRVYVQGSFDLFHRGHAKLLARAKKFASLDNCPDIFVGIISDEAYLRNRGYKPQESEDDRLRMIRAIGIGESFITDNLRTKDDLVKNEINIVIVGSDWAKKDIYKQYDLTQQWLDDRRIELIFVPYTEGISSTQIKKEMNEKTQS